jgi:hypothetical protein
MKLRVFEVEPSSINTSERSESVEPRLNTRVRLRGRTVKKVLGSANKVCLLLVVMWQLRYSAMLAGFGLGFLFDMGSAGAAEPAPSAQVSPTAAPAPSSTATAPDIVRLKSGGMVRGAISESIPGSHVLIVTLTGDHRRFDMSEVEYAGPAQQAAAPASADPSSAEPPKPKRPTPDAPPAARVKPRIVVHAGEARVKLRATEPLTFYLMDSATHAVSRASTAMRYTALCTSPCEVSIPAGTHKMALSRDRKLVETDALSIPEGNATIEGTYKDQSDTRAGGILLTVLGGIAATIVTPMLVLHNKRDTAIGVGLGGAASIGLGVGLIVVRDGASVSVVPHGGTQRSAGSSPHEPSNAGAGLSFDRRPGR